MTQPLDSLLEQSGALHRHVCPRQVLGVRMGLFGGECLGLAVPQPFESKRILTIVETDGCFADGISVAANCWVGRRTLRVEDYGKVAATFIDTFTGQAVRVNPHPQARERARALAPEASSRWHAQLLGYQRLATEELLVATPVALTLSLDKLVSRAGYRVTCTRCGEEVINEREVVRDGVVLCRPCAAGGYAHVEVRDLHHCYELDER
jgi:formylmethanofuran dehydrogenase subunit E